MRGKGQCGGYFIVGGRVEERTCLGSGMGIHTNGRACTHADRDLKKRQFDVRDEEGLWRDSGGAVRRSDSVLRREPHSAAALSRR